MARRRGARRPETATAEASLAPGPKESLDYKPYFPLKSIVDVLRVLHFDLSGKSEPNLAFWSVLLGLAEARFTGSPPVVPNQSTDAIPTAESHLENRLSAALYLPAIEYADVKAIFDKFEALVRSEAPMNSKGASSEFATADYDAVTRIKDCIWNGLGGLGSYEKAHLQFLTSYVTGYQLDSFGCATAVVAAGQLLKYADMHLALSEGHVWLAYGPGSTSRIEVSWHGKNPDTRKSITDADMKERWLYSGGQPLICDRLMELAMLFSIINPTRSATDDSINLMLTQYCLLHAMYTAGRLSHCPQAHVAMAEAAERLSAAPGLPPTLFMNCERVYKSAVRCARTRCADVFVNPYLALAAFYYRQGRYHDCMKCWTAAARVLGRFTYTAGDDDEPYKDFHDIVSEKIPHILTAEPSAPRSPTVFSYVIRIVDSLCKWEEGSNCAVLHAGWAKSVAAIASKFDFEVRRQVEMNPSESEQNTVEKPDPGINLPDAAAAASAADNDVALGSESPGISAPAVVVQLTSHKMSGLRKLLVAEKVSTEAIQLQMASQVGAPARKHGTKRLSNAAVAEDVRPQPPSKRASIALPTKPAEAVSKSTAPAVARGRTVAAVVASPDEARKPRADVLADVIKPAAEVVPAAEARDKPPSVPAAVATAMHETVADVIAKCPTASAAHATVAVPVVSPSANAHAKPTTRPAAAVTAKPSAAVPTVGGATKPVPLAVRQRNVVKRKPDFVKSFASSRGVCVRSEKSHAVIIHQSPNLLDPAMPIVSESPARLAVVASSGGITLDEVDNDYVQQRRSGSIALGTHRSVPPTSAAVATVDVDQSAAAQPSSSTGYKRKREERSEDSHVSSRRQSEAVVMPALRGRPRGSRRSIDAGVPGIDQPEVAERSSIPRRLRGHRTDDASGEAGTLAGSDKTPATEQTAAVALRSGGRRAAHAHRAELSAGSSSHVSSGAACTALSTDVAAEPVARSSRIANGSRCRALHGTVSLASADSCGTASDVVQTRGADKGHVLTSSLSIILEEPRGLPYPSNRRASTEPDQMPESVRARTGARRLGRPPRNLEDNSGRPAAGPAEGSGAAGNRKRNPEDSSGSTAAGPAEGPGVTGSRKRKMSDSFPSKTSLAAVDTTAQGFESQGLSTGGIFSATTSAAVSSISMPQSSSTEEAANPTEGDPASECGATANGNGDTDGSDNNPVLLSTRRRQMAFVNPGRRGLRSPENFAAAQRARLIGPSPSNGTSALSSEATYLRSTGESQPSDLAHLPHVASNNGLGSRSAIDHSGDSVDTHRRWGRRRRSSAQSSSSAEEALSERRSIPALRIHRIANRAVAREITESPIEPIDRSSSSDDEDDAPVAEAEGAMSATATETPKEGST